MTLDQTLYIDSAQKFENLMRELSSHTDIGLDTDFIPDGHYEPELALVLLSHAWCTQAAFRRRAHRYENLR